MEANGACDFSCGTFAGVNVREVGAVADGRAGRIVAVGFEMAKLYGAEALTALINAAVRRDTQATSQAEKSAKGVVGAVQSN